MQTRLLLTLATGIAVALASLASPPPPATAQAETMQLFNGKDLTNFYTWLVDHHYEDPNRVFTVVESVDGEPAIRVSGQGYGAFITKEPYENYRLSAEYRWGILTWGGRKDRSRDSGILVHCQGRDGNTGRDFNGPWMLSQECQVIEGGTGDFIPVSGTMEDGTRVSPSYTATVRADGNRLYYDPNGESRDVSGRQLWWYGRDPEWRDVIGFRGKNDVETPYPGWTKVEVICDGDSITHLVNGTVVNKVTNSSLAKGKIIFQSEGAELFYRNISITPLRR